MTHIRDLSEHSKRAMEFASETFKAFRDLDPEFPLGQVRFFLHAASNEGLSVAELTKLSGLPRATGSRYLKKLCNTSEHPGLGLLYAYKNPKRASQKLVVLTQKGNELVERLHLIEEAAGRT